MAKDLRTAKTYHVGKKSFIKLAKDYCEYELPKMKDIAFTQYQGTYWLDFINDDDFRVQITLIKCGDDIRFEFGVLRMILIKITTLENNIMDQYFEEKVKKPQISLAK
ncbi:MAG: hypothetical protein ACLTSC_00730 [Mediterraneibacter faecis]